MERTRNELRPLLGSGDGGGALPVRPRAQGDAHPPPQPHRVRVARLRGGRRPGPALWLSRSRRLGAGERTALQPRQRAPRSLRARAQRRGGLQPGSELLRRHASGQGSGPRRGRPARRPAGRGHRSHLRLGRRQAAQHASPAIGHLRGARQGPQHPSSGGARGPARDVPRPGQRAHRPLPARARGHGHRALAHSRLRRRPVSPRSEALQLLGL